MTSPTLGFGRHRGLTVDQAPDDYVRWLADEERHKKAGKPYAPLPSDIVAAAKARVTVLDEARERERFAALVMGGHATGHESPIYIIECEGDCHSRSGAYAIDNRWFRSLDQALAHLAEEFPVEEREDIGGEKSTSRSTPDPEDDMIVVWEVLPSAHRRIVWGFFGWHHSHAQEHAQCGQGTLPGDDATLYDLAMRDY